MKRRWRRVLRSMWSFSWLVTLPVTAVFGYWLLSTIDRYHSFGVRYDSRPVQFSLSDTGAAEASNMLRQLSLGLQSESSQKRGLDALRTVQLFVPESGLAQLDSDLPHSGFEFVRAGIQHGEATIKCRVRYRGDFAPHWGFHKKSFRVKTGRNELWEGMRVFNLIVPKFPAQLNNYLGYRLADRLGLVTPRVELVHLAINGRIDGVRLLVEQLEELTLRSNDLMPGDLYSGELMAKDRYLGVWESLFAHPRLWEKVSINNHYPPESMVPIERLMALVNAPGNEHIQEELSRLLDMEVWGRFNAFETLAHSFHYDRTHNWRLYWDANRGRFKPVVWDPIAFAPRMDVPEVSLDVITSQLQAVLMENGDFLRARHYAIKDFFQRNEDDAFLAEADDIIGRLALARTVDPNLRFEPAQIERGIADMQTSIERIFSEVERAYLHPSGSVQYSTDETNRVSLSVEGRRPVERVVCELTTPIQGPVTVEVRFYRDGQQVSSDITASASVQGSRIEIDAGLLPQFEAFYRQAGAIKKSNRRKLRPGYYELVLGGLGTASRIRELLVDRGSGLEPAQAKDVVQRREFRDQFRLVPERPQLAPLELSGEVELSGLVEVRRPVIVSPGTTLKMAPGASVRLWDRIIAEGTKDQPIRIIPAEPNQEPWGAFVIQGPKAAGSRLSWCEFALGSGLKSAMYEYSAMFSVHDVPEISVEHCHFRDSRVVDDMVHVIYSRADFKDCLFESSLFDAIDLDICTATLQGCRFIRSGNDALDLMTSKVVVVDTLLRDSGDKGISVGEGSSLLVIDSRFEGCFTGIEGKDSSVAIVSNCAFERNQTAINCYKKNWRYDKGGTVLVRKSQILENEKYLSADKSSLIEVRDSYLHSAAIEELDLAARDRPKIKRRIVLRDDVDTSRKETAANRRSEPFPKELADIESLAAPFWSRMKPSVRGISSGRL